MNAWDWYGWGLLAVLLFWAIGAYNRVMQLRNAIGTAYAQLDEALGQRTQHSARLMELARPVLTNEQASFDALETAQSEAQAAASAVRARPYAADPVATLAVAAAVHAAALTRLMSLVEHHGELRSQAEVDRLLDELKLVERHRAFSRQVYNQAVQAYNEALHQFPTRVLCSFLGFNEARSI